MRVFLVLQDLLAMRGGPTSLKKGVRLPILANTIDGPLLNNK
jgi:hypothetical protein